MNNGRMIRERKPGLQLNKNDIDSDDDNTHYFYRAWDFNKKVPEIRRKKPL